MHLIESDIVHRCWTYNCFVYIVVPLWPQDLSLQGADSMVRSNLKSQDEIKVHIVSVWIMSGDLLTDKFLSHSEFLNLATEDN